MDIAFVDERYSTQLRRPMESVHYVEQLLSGIYQIVNYGIAERKQNNMTHDKYDNDILKTLRSIDMSLKIIAQSVKSTNTTVDNIDNNSEEAVREFLNSLH